MEFRDFKYDTFFKPNVHPSPQIFSDSDFQNVIQKIEADRPLRENPLQNPSISDIDPLKSPQTKPAYIPSQNPETFNTGEINATKIDSGQFDLPLSENNDAHLNTFATKPAILENEFQIEAFKIILNRGFDILFIYLSRNFGRDMRLTPDENKTLVESAIPVAKKYSKGNIKYAEEIGLLLSLGGVIAAKTIFMNENEIKKEDEKMPEQPDIDPSIKQTATGMMEVLKDTIKKGDIQSREIDDIEFQKAKKLMGIYNPSLEATRKDCETFIAILESMGMSLDFLSEIADKVDPEQIKKMFHGVVIK